ncbi:hypothetical protein FB567DRAFT_564734 [Paraphoma chrysanthemicola]|uniref:Uncharacterized protein n=1 Tax=Paraphoma chrysanthemicola TaxID=798071 RepID=A0A8K0QTT7_9PLEO|nr:hypothetical protein FB567DRAFT_564734 [Paraphoma chrysanthemicola]
MRTRWESHICDLTGAVVSYNVVLSSQGITRGVGDESVVKDLVMPGPGTWGHHSNIGGFEYAASYLFTSNATFHFAGAVSSATLTGSLANEVVSGDDAWNLTFSDPMNGMLDTMREIAFRTAVRAGKDYANVTNSTQDVQYTGRSTHSIYNTDFRYMAAAVVVSILSVIAISITFYGWWELGRTVSLSPLEIAKAFDAPLLAHIGSNLDLSHNKHLGPIATRRVRYGAKINEQDYSTQYTGGQGHQRRRLVMGVAGEVRTPTAGEPFGN